MIPDTIRQLGPEANFAAGAALPAGSPGDPMLYLLLNGCVVIEEPGQGVSSVFWPEELVAPTGPARTVTEVTCVAFTESALVAEMGNSPKVAAWAWAQQKRRIQQLRRQIQLRSIPVEQRVAQTLAELSGQAKATHPDAVIPLSQQQVADLVGATRETTSSLLNRLRREGLLTLRRRQILVPSPDELKSVGQAR